MISRGLKFRVFDLLFWSPLYFQAPSKCNQVRGQDVSETGKHETSPLRNHETIEPHIYNDNPELQPLTGNGSANYHKWTGKNPTLLRSICPKQKEPSSIASVQKPTQRFQCQCLHTPLANIFHQQAWWDWMTTERRSQSSCQIFGLLFHAPLTFNFDVGCQIFKLNLTLNVEIGKWKSLTV